MRALSGVTGMLVAGSVLIAAGALAADDQQVDAYNAELVAHLDTANGGDIAFWGDHAFVVDGALDSVPANDGFTVVDVSEPTSPTVVSEFPCFGAGSDIGVWRDLVVLSVDISTGAGRGCGEPSAGEAEFKGVRIVSVADPARPRWLADVATPNGSHTHTLLPDLEPRAGDAQWEPRLLVFSNNGYSPPATDADPRGLESVVVVPLSNPAAARAVPRPQGVPYAPALAPVPPALAPGGSAFNTPPDLGCHDMSLLVSRRLAACSGLQPDTQLWDITDPLRPALLSVITNPLIEHHHSSGFSWDGDTLVIAEESVSNHAGTRCGSGSGSPKAALWFYDIADPRSPVLRGWFQTEQQGNAGYCSPHYFNVIPLPGRDVLVTSWAGAGTSVVDFTDPTRPALIAHWNVLSADRDRASFPYASYWHNGFVYVNNARGVIPGVVDMGGDRGLDVLRLDVPGLREALRMQGFSHGTQDCKPARPACDRLLAGTED